MRPFVLELFAGSRSIGKVAETMGCEVWSTDVVQFGGIDKVADFMDLDLDSMDQIIPKNRPLLVWASPPCTTFSIASVSHHWRRYPNGMLRPKSEAAKLGRELALKTAYWCEQLAERHGAVWFIENPRGMMRKMSWMYPPQLNGRRHTVTYCQYGDHRMKPTDIWTNSRHWLPRPMCSPGADCHESAPRGSRTGTQGLKNNHERSKIPTALCRSVIESFVSNL